VFNPDDPEGNYVLDDGGWRRCWTGEKVRKTDGCEETKKGEPLELQFLPPHLETQDCLPEYTEEDELLKELYLQQDNQEKPENQNTAKETKSLEKDFKEVTEQRKQSKIKHEARDLEEEKEVQGLPPKTVGREEVISVEAGGDLNEARNPTELQTEDEGIVKALESVIREEKSEENTSLKSEEEPKEIAESRSDADIKAAASEEGREVEKMALSEEIAESQSDAETKEKSDVTDAEAARIKMRSEEDKIVD